MKRISKLFSLIAVSCVILSGCQSNTPQESQTAEVSGSEATNSVASKSEASISEVADSSEIADSTEASESETAEKADTADSPADDSELIYDFDTSNLSDSMEYIMGRYYDFAYSINNDEDWARDSNGELLWGEGELSSFAEINCDYTIDEIKEKLGRYLMGKKLDYALSIVDSNLRESDGKIYAFVSESGRFLRELCDVLYPETAVIAEQSDDSVTVNMEAWDSGYETLYKAEIIISKDTDGAWKIASLSFGSID